MKTKHILTALALPALLAACNNDEFESMNFEQAQSERPLLSEDFVLKMGFEGADTRYAVEGNSSLNFKFTDGDQLGAAIIDQYDPQKPIEQWDVIYSLAGNNPFTYGANADEWKSATRLGIGHYLYVYPYNAEDNNRAAVSYSLPTIQELYQTEDGAVDLNAAIEKGNKAVYSNILDEDNLTLEASLKNLYAYPKFVINFDNGQNVTSVSKVVLEYDDNANGIIEEGEGFAVKGGFNHKDVANLFANPKTDWDNIQTADFVIDETDADYNTAKDYTTVEYSRYLIAKLPKNAKVQTNSVTNNKYIEVRFMMPSGLDNVYGNGELNMYIYTNNGVYKINDVFGSIVFKDTTPEELKARVFARNTSFTLNMSTLTSANKVNDNLNIVTNVEDWNNLVSAYGSFEKFTATDPLKVAVVGDDFTLNASAKMPSKAIFEITTEVKVEGEVTLSNVQVANTVTVEEGATLTTSGSFTATKVENNGTMNIAVATDEDNDVVLYEGVKDIENNGTLNIAKDAKATFALKNTKGAVVTNNGEITISGNNFGEINNETIIKTTGFTNNEPADAKKDPMPTINNAADARIMAQSGKLINNALIVNEGSITCKNMGGEIVNNGDLDSKETALTYITDNKGTIIVYSENTTNLTIGGYVGTVEYTTDKTSVDFTNSLVNTVIASKNLTVIGNTLASVTFEKTAELTLGKGGYVNVLNVNGGITTVKSNMNVNTLNVAKGAQITVPEKITLTVTGNEINNQGRILVGGTFNAKNIQSTDNGVGTVEDNGNGKINWELSDEDQAIEDAKEAYNTALTAMVDAWMLDSNRNTWESVYNMAAGSWNSSTPWSTLCNDAIAKYNALHKLTDGNQVDYNEFIAILNKEAESIINGYKNYGDSKRGEAIAKVYKDNSWVNNNVYIKATADTKFNEIATTGHTTMISSFITRVNGITGVSISTKPIENKAIELSLKATKEADIQENWIPAYSYIRTYAGAEEYDVMYALKKSNFDNSWFNSQTLTTLAGVQKAIATVYDEYHGGNLGIQEKKKIENSGLLNYVDTVLDDWKFKDAQINQLNTAIK